jgi:hypothetical protein
MHFEFAALIDGLSKGEVSWVTPSEPRYLRLDFISKVISFTSERIRDAWMEKQSEEEDWSDARNLLGLSQAFYDLGEPVSPRPVAYSDRAKPKIKSMVETATDDLEQYLLTRYPGNPTEDELEEIKFDLLGVSAQFLAEQWGSKVEALSPHTHSARLGQE